MRTLGDDPASPTAHQLTTRRAFPTPVFDEPKRAVAAYNKRAKEVGKPLTVLDRKITAALIKKSAAIIDSVAASISSSSSSGAGSGSSSSGSSGSSAKAKASIGNSSTAVSFNTQAAIKSRCEPQTARQMLGSMQAVVAGQVSDIRARACVNRFIGTLCTSHCVRPATPTTPKHPQSYAPSLYCMAGGLHELIQRRHMVARQGALCVRLRARVG